MFQGPSFLDIYVIFWWVQRWFQTVLGLFFKPENRGIYPSWSICFVHGRRDYPTQESQKIIPRKPYKSAEKSDVHVPFLAGSGCKKNITTLEGAQKMMGFLQLFVESNQVVFFDRSRVPNSLHLERLKTSEVSWIDWLFNSIRVGTFFPNSESMI